MDQLIGNTAGSEMIEFIDQPKLVFKSYLNKRLRRSEPQLLSTSKEVTDRKSIRYIISWLKLFIFTRIISVVSIAYRIGDFCISAGAHQCMFDRFMSSNSLSINQFTDLQVIDASKPMFPVGI